MTKYQSLIERLYFLYYSYRYVYNFYQSDMKLRKSEFVYYVDFDSSHYRVFNNFGEKSYSDILKNDVLKFQLHNIINYRVLIKMTINEIREYKIKYPNYKPFYFYQISGMLERYSTYLFFSKKYKNIHGRNNALLYFNSLVAKKSIKG